jgi:hypothetical protein
LGVKARRFCCGAVVAADKAAIFKMRKLLPEKGY